MNEVQDGFLQLEGPWEPVQSVDPDYSLLSEPEVEGLS